MLHSKWTSSTLEPRGLGCGGKREGAEITGAVDNVLLLAVFVQARSTGPGVKDHWIAIMNPRFHGTRLYTPAPAPMFFQSAPANGPFTRYPLC